MKNISMSNREFKKARKYFKKKFIEGNLTEAVRKTEEYKIFELEEEKRKKANDFVNEWLETAAISPSLVKMGKIYFKKYISFIAERDTLDAEFRKLHNNEKMDDKTFTECINDRVFEFERIIAIPAIEYADRPRTKFASYGFYYYEMDRIECEEAVLWIRRATCALGVALNKLRKKLEDIKKRELEFIKAKKIREVKFKHDEKAREFEYTFSQRYR